MKMEPSGMASEHLQKEARELVSPFYQLRHSEEMSSMNQEAGSAWMLTAGVSACWSWTFQSPEL